MNPAPNDKDRACLRDVIRLYQIAVEDWDFDGMAAVLLRIVHHREEAVRELEADRKRLDWLETQDVWIGIEGEYDVTPRITCGKSYRDKVRSSIDAAMKAKS